MESSRIRYLLRPWVVMSLAAAASLSSGSASAGDPTCVYNASQRKVTATVTAPHDDELNFHREGNEIVARNVDCGAATRFNTNKIVLNDAFGHDLIGVIDLSGGRFVPGHRNESGASDEIEFKFKLADSINNFEVAGTARRDKVRGGFVDPGSGPTRLKVNLNAGEATGVDADVTVTGSLDAPSFDGKRGEDVLSAAGGKGTGSSYPGPTAIYGRRGGDLVIGGRGPDLLYGHGGEDRLEGRRGPDMLEGGPANDELFGGAGTDSCGGGSGFNLLHGCE
jgi:Ca2+-binding RTX toxin-like protein